MKIWTVWDSKAFFKVHTPASARLITICSSKFWSWILYSNTWVKEGAYSTGKITTIYTISAFLSKLSVILFNMLEITGYPFRTVSISKVETFFGFNFLKTHVTTFHVFLALIPVCKYLTTVFAIKSELNFLLVQSL